MTILKSILAVVGSYALSIVLVMLTDPLLNKLFPNDYVKGQPTPDNLLILGTALFVVISIFCGWLCARLAPARAWTHVLWFFALGEVMGIVATFFNWGKVPHWYSIAWLVVWLPAVWIGYKLARR